MQQSQIDILDPARANALFVTLGMTDVVEVGDELPPFFHHIYFWDPQQAEDLGRDGHPKTGKGLIPDLGLPRRMWAGGQLEFLAPLRVGQEATKPALSTKRSRKQGALDLWPLSPCCMKSHKMDKSACGNSKIWCTERIQTHLPRHHSLRWQKRMKPTGKRRPLAQHNFFAIPP